MCKPGFVLVLLTWCVLSLAVMCISYVTCLVFQCVAFKYQPQEPGEIFVGVL
jgi:hypothetical protein